MTSQNKARKLDKIGLWLVLAVILITGAVFMWTSSHFQQKNTAIETHVDAHGHLHVLGIVLGETSLNQAEKILQSKSDVALFIYPQGHPKAGLKLEAFFPAIADHTKVILLLHMETGSLFDIEKRATLPHQYENKVVRMNLAADDVTKVHQATVQELTLIPNLNLSAANLQARFGKPDRIKKLDSKRMQYTFDAIGLQAILTENETPTLHFSNPTLVK